MALLQEEGVDLKLCLPEFNKGEEDINYDAFMRTIVEKLLIHFQKSGNEKIDNDEIPDGFYLVGDSENPQKEWSKAIIDKVRTITHICAPDPDGNLVGGPISQEGEVCFPIHKEFLCASVTGARFSTTTEVYPDSTVPGCTDQQCNDA